MMQEELTKVQQTEHVLVCLSPSPTNRRIIEEAAKLAKAFRAEFTAIYVQTSQKESLTEDAKERLQKNTRFAQDNGATIITVVGEDVSFQIAEYARISGVTKIVIGRSAARQGHFWKKQSLTEQLIHSAPNIDIYIIPDSKALIQKSNNRRFAEQIIPTWKEVLITALLLIGVTALGLVFGKLGFTEANIITVYILGVLVIAILTKSHACSFASSFCSVLLFNYFFTEPKLTFHAYEPGYSATFFVMLIASLLTGSLAYRLKDTARDAAMSAFRTNVLFDTNQLLQKKRTEEEVLEVLANQVMLLLECDVVIYPVRGNEILGGHVYTKEGTFEVTAREYEVDQGAISWVLEHKKKAGATTKYHPEAKRLYLAIRNNKMVYGIVGIRNEKREFSSFEESVLLSILGECALALENLKNEKAKEEASLAAQNEKLRANLLRTISHDLRTPLTSISGNASNLCSHYKQLDDETREQIFSDIYDDSEWLIQLVENLLSVTRIENGEMKLNASLEVMDDVIDEAIKHIDRNKVNHTIIVHRPKEIVIAEIDAKLITQVLINIVNNAIKYSQKGSTILVEYGTDKEEVFVNISDNGPGMNDEMKEHAFDMFYTGQNRIVDSKRGMGLGLALCKSVVEAHGGRIEIKDNEPSGCIFTLYLNKGEVSIEE